MPKTLAAGAALLALCSPPAGASVDGAVYKTYRLRWPARPGQTVTYRVSFKSRTVRAITMRTHGRAVPRGFAYDYIVVCAHRGPGFLDWDWTASGSYVLIKVVMIAGYCDPGPP